MPIPKTEAELKEIADYATFYEKTKEFRVQLQVKQMINERKVKQKALMMEKGNTNQDPLYQVESTQDIKVKKLDPEKFNDLPL